MVLNIIRRLGGGAFGDVYLAEDRSLRRLIAVKTSPNQNSATLRNEYALLIRFNDFPFIVRCLGQEISPGPNNNSLYCLKLEYAPHGTLSNLIQNNGGRLPLPRVKRFTYMILRGLYDVHRNSIVHYDMKPDNILVFDGNGGRHVLKIADFGLARNTNSTCCQPHPCGDLHYASPEAAHCISTRQCSRRVITTAADIWSFGLIVRKMLTGESPWERYNGNLNAIRNALVSGSARPRIPEELSNEAKDFLEQCFHIHPQRRSSAGDLLNHRFLRGVRP